MPYLRPDPDWSPFRNDPAYRPLLLETAAVFVALVKARSDRLALATDEAGRKRVLEAYGRAVGALSQLPMEFGDGAQRFDRSPWRHVTVQPGTNQPGLHCEHPWSKHLTRKLVRHAVEAGVASGAAEDTILGAVADILDARQPTVTLPSLKISKSKVRGGRSDGLARYERAIVDGSIVQRPSKVPVTPDQMRAIDAEAVRKVDSALARVGATERYEDICAAWMTTPIGRR
jgi:hypothetical protein